LVYSAASKRAAAILRWSSACELTSIATAFTPSSTYRRSQRAASVGPGVVNPSVPGITFPSWSTAPRVPIDPAGARRPSRCRRMAVQVVFPFVPVMPISVSSFHGSP
jgi:hypothetical protein